MWVVLAAMLTSCMVTGDARLVEDIKLFDVVNISNVPETRGYSNKSKAYEFLKSDTTSDLIALANVSTLFAKEVHLIKEFTVKAYFLAAAGSEGGGTIVFFSRSPKKSDTGFSLVVKWLSDDRLKIDTTFYIPAIGSDVLVSCDEFDNLQGISRNEWLFLQVRVHVPERLIRCEIKTPTGKSYYRSKSRESDKQPFEQFAPDGSLRLAQQYQSGSESLRGITDRFVGKLQDVIISFGDPNCTITIDDTYVPPTTTAAPVTTTSTTKKPKDDTCYDGNDHIRQDRETWDEGNGVKCKCNKGKTYCVKSAKPCLMGGKEYREGEEWNDLSSCDRCTCMDGIATCQGTGRKKQLGCEKTCSDQNCREKVEGCFCPGAKVDLNGNCVDATACPCIHQGKPYAAGLHKIGCDICQCSNKNMFCVKGANPDC